MSLISLLVFILVVSVILYLVDMLPLPDARAKAIVRAIVVVIALCYVLEAIGLFSGPALRLH